jgi:YD repeat-containing protein
MPYIPFIHHAEYSAPKFTGDHLERMLTGRTGEGADNRPLTRAQRFVQAARRGLSTFVCLAVTNATVPGSAVVDFGKPAREAFLDHQIQVQAQARELAKRKAKSATRLLSNKEMSELQGKSGENPYYAGQQKFDVVYRGVDLMSGNYSMSVTDMSFDTGFGIPVNVTRSYSANNPDEGPFGKGWELSADVRSTAGGILKAKNSAVLAVPQSFKERPAGESDPNITTQPAAAIVTADSSGHQETIQKDADGILTTPPWDNNTHNNVYQWVNFGGQMYQILVSDTVVTTDGTSYVYQNLGTYPNGEVPWTNPSATPTPTNVLKPTTVTDRQGNVTTYTYNTSTTVSFSTSNGQITVNPLTSVTMPNGQSITFTWGDGTHAPTNRIWKISDNSAPARIVTYGYNSSGMLTSVTTPGGKITQYGYGNATVESNDPNTPPQTAYNILSTITDARGMTTTIKSAVGGNYYWSTTYIPLRVGVYEIDHPDGTQTNYSFYAVYGLTEGDAGVNDSYAEDYNPAEVGTTTYGDNLIHISYQPFVSNSQQYYGVLQDAVHDDDKSVHDVTTSISYYDVNQDPVSVVVGPGFTGGDQLSINRHLDVSSMNSNVVSTTTAFNFMGNPLSKTTYEYGPNANTLNFSSFGSTTYTPYRTQTLNYAYWDITKYYQQKAIWDVSANRYTYTDYFPSTAAAGQRGQKAFDWDPAYGQINPTGLGSGVVPKYMQNDPADWWKYEITAPSTTYSGAYAYDGYGRCTDTWRLKSASPWKYVQTHTDYGALTPGIWGATKDVIEDYNGLNRTTTTKNYTPYGKPSDVVNAAGHEFITNYDPDGLVNSVLQYDTGQTIVTYTYGTTNGQVENGQVRSIKDGLTNVTLNIGYGQPGSGSAYGNVVSVTQSGAQTSSVAYTYDSSADRLTASYTTPYGTTNWGYFDYINTGDPSKSQRVARTIVKLDSNFNRTAEEYQYTYDAQGHMCEGVFAQTPTATSPNSTDGWYDSAGQAATRCRAHYDYDAGGRLLDIYHYWDTWSTNSNAYSSIAVLGNSCTYETGTGLNRGLKLSSTFYAPASQNSPSFAAQWQETYGYDPNLDYLTSFSTTDGQANSSKTWTYDAAANRTDTVADDLNRPTSIGGTSVSSDILGDRTAYGSLQYTWDSLARMTSFTNSSGTTNYTYRGDGIRVSKT